jgi:hypothetical protein
LIEKSFLGSSRRTGRSRHGDRLAGGRETHGRQPSRGQGKERITMFYLFHFVSLLLGGMLELDLGADTSLRNLKGADESDNSGGLDIGG